MITRLKNWALPLLFFAGFSYFVGCTSLEEKRRQFESGTLESVTAKLEEGYSEKSDEWLQKKYSELVDEVKEKTDTCNEGIDPEIRCWDGIARKTLETIAIHNVLANRWVPNAGGSGTVFDLRIDPILEYLGAGKRLYLQVLGVGACFDLFISGSEYSGDYENETQRPVDYSKATTSPEGEYRRIDVILKQYRIVEEQREPKIQARFKAQKLYTASKNYSIGKLCW